MTLNKTEEERMREVFEAHIPFKMQMHRDTNGRYLNERVRIAWEACCAVISHANSQHSTLIEECDRIARVAEMQATEITRLQNKLMTANAAIAMKDEALKELVMLHSKTYELSPEGRKYLASLNEVISTTLKQVSEWEEKKLEPLRKQVAMLRDVIERTSKEFRHGIHSADVSDMRTESLVNTQAAADAYKLEIATNAKQELVTWLYECGYLTKAAEQLYENEKLRSRLRE